MGEENLAKRMDKNDKNIDVKPCPIQREREKFEKLLKSEFEQVKLSFLKNLIHNFRLIEIDRGSLKFLKTILIDRKTNSINRNK